MFCQVLVYFHPNHCRGTFFNVKFFSQILPDWCNCPTLLPYLSIKLLVETCPVMHDPVVMKMMRTVELEVHLLLDHLPRVNLSGPQAYTVGLCNPDQSAQHQVLSVWENKSFSFSLKMSFIVVVKINLMLRQDVKYFVIL